MTWLDKWIFDQPYYDKLLHAGGCGGLVLVVWFFTYSLLWSALIALAAGVAKELIDCYNLADTKGDWHWYWDWWDILADVVGIGLAVGLIWWKGC